MASIPRVDVLGFGEDASGISCFRPPDHPTLVVNNYDLQYKQESIINCLICKRNIYINSEATVDIYCNYTTTSKSLLADAITNLILSDSPHVAFPTTTICMHCYSMVDRADSLHQEFMEIRAALKDKMANIIQQQWGHETTEPLPVVEETMTSITPAVVQEKTDQVLEQTQKLPLLRKPHRLTPVEVCVPGLTFLPSEDQYEYPCLFCFTKFKEKAFLAEHFDREHGRKSKVECKICNKEVEGGLKFFMYHMGAKHSLKELKDGMGDLRVKDSNLLSLKKLKNSANEVMKLRRVNCLKCQVSMSETVFDEHMRNNHARNRHQICDICNAAVSMRKFKSHMLEKHEIGTPYTCPSCPEQFTKKYKLYIHRERIHGMPRAPEKRIQCPKCPKTFTKAYSMKLHCRFIHENQRPNICHICSAAFQMKGSLNIHLRKHAGIRPYVCEICSKTFDRVTECKKHIRKVHKIQCNTRFNDALHPNSLPIKVLKQDLMD